MVVGSRSGVHAHSHPDTAATVTPSLPPFAAAPLLKLPVPSRLFPQHFGIYFRFSRRRRHRRVGLSRHLNARLSLHPRQSPLLALFLPLVVLHLHLGHHGDRLGDGVLFAVGLFDGVVAGVAAPSTATVAAHSAAPAAPRTVPASTARETGRCVEVSNICEAQIAWFNKANELREHLLDSSPLSPECPPWPPPPPLSPPLDS